ncbi:hypothetical protein ACHWQZ_G012452 [Mnemiopsis leidyi]
MIGNYDQNGDLQTPSASHNILQTNKGCRTNRYYLFIAIRIRCNNISKMRESALCYLNVLYCLETCYICKVFIQLT